MKPTQTVLSPKVEIRESPIQGRGMFAIAPIQKGELVVRWGGDYVGSHKAGLAKAEGKLVIQWDDDLYSVEDRGVDDGYFVNHSCDSNLWMYGAFRLKARRDIKVGEELTADYALWEASEDYKSTWICRCGSKDCRGRVTGKDWQQRSVQIKYTGHFSPLINKQIDQTS